ncbi:4-oxalocrotonate tautomerase [Corynebacterium deserti GIMN1.010]|uniref:4-oxalocrotonate tautomerase n=1 Tax=Corynebacterium deserti GIMN1.010 TaxID=931089 RepID=A0A0M4CJJ5_9CORY|nr:tautomerase family protein [Corynebacterium deserti]ALC04547.1 4-oxalocrotonate tautomerase [Corynebacterium deserti GIMN1.010]
MPTYTCWSRRIQISRESKHRIAEAITDAHHELAKAPKYLVQVLFNEVEPDSHFIGGHPAPDNQIWVHATIRAGRTKEQKDSLLLRLTEEIALILGIPKEVVWVYINEIPGGNMTEYGRLLLEPGQEDEWFASLPEALQERLTDLSED